MVLMEGETVAKGELIIVAESLDYILENAKKNARTGDHAVLDNLAKYVLLDLQRRKVSGNTLNRHILAYFSSNDASSKIGGKRLSTDSSMGTDEANR